jgi:hypothetical protein
MRRDADDLARAKPRRKFDEIPENGRRTSMGMLLPWVIDVLPVRPAGPLGYL